MMKIEWLVNGTILMRVLICKIHCPFMCFCKPSAAHLYTSGPLKLDNTPHSVVSSTAYAVSAVCNESSSEVDEESVTGGIGKHETGTVPKSCMRKIACGPDSDKEAKKKRVQWMDELGQELAEIKEFESSDTEETVNDEESSRCLCVIL